MSSAAVIAAGAAAVAANAAHQARLAECKVVVSGFDSKTATVEKARAYADCVHLLYPSHTAAPVSFVFALKMLFIVAILSAIVAGWYEAKKGFMPSWGSIAVAAGMGFVIGPFLIILGLATVKGFIWLFS